MLERASQLESDAVLVALVRLAQIATDASEAIYERCQRTEQQSHLILLGLETQARELKNRIPNHIAAASMYSSQLSCPQIKARYDLVLL